MRIMERLLSLAPRWSIVPLILLSLVATGTAGAGQTLGAAWVARVESAPGGDGRSSAIAVDAVGDVYVAGAVYNGDPGSGGTGLDYLTVKYSGATGSKIWSAQYNGTGNGDDVAAALVVDPSGHLWVTGHAFNGDPVNGGSSDDIVTLEYDSATGALVDTRVYNGPGNGQDQGTAIAADASGNVYVGGSGFAGPATQVDYVILRYGVADGVNWERTYDGGTGGNDQATGIAVDSGGNAFVVGASYGGDPSAGGTGADYATVSFAPDGTQRWVVREDGPGHGFDKATSVAVASNGDVVVHGFVTGPTDFDFLTVRYGGADGHTIWRTEYDSSSHQPDVATAAGLSPDGAVYVTGYSGVPPFQSFLTLRLSGVDGSVEWTRSYSGPAGFQSIANALATEASGAVYVGGFSYGSGTAADYATLKYTAQGIQSFEGRYNNVPAGDDRLTALAAGTDGDVWVTGTSSNGASLGIATLRYATANHPPVASAGPGQTIECAGSTTTVHLDASASTDIDGDPLTFVWSEDDTPFAGGITPTVQLSAGTHLISVTVSDNRGGSDTADVTIVISDTIAPDISAPPTITLASTPGACSAMVPSTPPDVSDNCGSPSLVGARNDGRSLTDPFPVGTTTIVWTATDRAGNSSSAIQSVIVLDHEPPVITCPSDLTVAQSFPGGSGVGFAVTATDNCSLNPEVTTSPLSGSLFPVGTTTVTCTATDDAGNTANCTFRVTVTALPSTGGARVTGSGKVLVNGAPASFTLQARTVSAQKVKGHFTYQEKHHGRTLHSTGITSLQVSGSQVSLFGNAKDEHHKAVGFGLTIDTASPRSPQFTLTFSDGYTVGPSPLVSGKVRLH